MTDFSITNNTAKPVAITDNQKVQIKSQLSGINSQSSIWDNYKHLDTNNDGSLADEKISDDILYSTGQKLGIIPDSKIQETKQGQANDCWLLSGTQALSNTEWGSKAIEQALDTNHTGKTDDPYLVTLTNSEGKKIQVPVTSEDLSSYGKDKLTYSEGDIDMNILEAGIAKYFTTEIKAGRLDKNIDDPIGGGVAAGKYSINYLLIGKEGQGLTTARINPEYKDVYQKLTTDNLEEVLVNYADDTSKTAMTCAFKEPSFMQKLFNNTSKNEQMSNHEYIITNVKKNPAGEITTVSYKNPWDTSIEYTIPYETFQKRAAQISWLTNE